MVNLRSAAGSSLLELMITMGISVGVLGASTMLAGQVQSRYQVVAESASAKQEARYAIDLISRYLRSAGNNPLAVSISPCPVAGTPVTGIRMDPDGDGQHDDIRLQSDIAPTNGRIGGSAGNCTEANEDVTIAYDAAASTITIEDHNVADGPEARTDAVISGLEFVYRDGAHAITAVANNIAFVEIVVTARSRVNDPATNAPMTHVLRADLRVRNR